MPTEPPTIAVCSSFEKIHRASPYTQIRMNNSGYSVFNGITALKPIV